MRPSDKTNTMLTSDNKDYFVTEADKIATDLVPPGKNPEDAKRYGKADPRFSVEEYLESMKGHTLADKVDMNQGVENRGKLLSVNSEGNVYCKDPSVEFVPNTLKSNREKQVVLDEVDSKLGYYNAAGEFVPFKQREGTAKEKEVVEGVTFMNATDDDVHVGTMKTATNFPLTSSGDEDYTINAPSDYYFHSEGIKVTGNSANKGTIVASQVTSTPSSVANGQAKWLYNGSYIYVYPGKGYWPGKTVANDSSKGATIQVSSNNMGSATPGDVMSGYTFSSNGYWCASGTMILPPAKTITTMKSTQSKTSQTHTSMTYTFTTSYSNLIAILYMNDSDNNDDNYFNVSGTSGTWTIGGKHYNGSGGHPWPMSIAKYLTGGSSMETWNGDGYNNHFWWVAYKSSVSSNTTVTFTKGNWGTDISCIIMYVPNSSAYSRIINVLS